MKTAEQMNNCCRTLVKKIILKSEKINIRMKVHKVSTYWKKYKIKREKTPNNKEVEAKTQTKANQIKRQREALTLLETKSAI